MESKDSIGVFDKVFMNLCKDCYEKLKEKKKVKNGRQSKQEI